MNDAGGKCLIVEDDPVSLTILADYLKPYSLCETACNGVEALERYSASLYAGTPYRFILLDIMMPEMDGVEAARRIRRLEMEQGIPIESGVPIIFISAIESPKEIINAYCVAQSSAHLVKPVSREKVLSTLRKLELIP